MGYRLAHVHRNFLLILFTMWCSSTFCGVLRLVVSPWPSWPKLLRPKASTVPRVGQLAPVHAQYTGSETITFDIACNFRCAHRSRTKAGTGQNARHIRIHWRRFIPYQINRVFLVHSLHITLFLRCRLESKSCASFFYY